MLHQTILIFKMSHLFDKESNMGYMAPEAVERRKRYKMEKYRWRTMYKYRINCSDWHKWINKLFILQEQTFGGCFGGVYVALVKGRLRASICHQVILEKKKKLFKVKILTKCKANLIHNNPENLWCAYQTAGGRCCRFWTWSSGKNNLQPFCNSMRFHQQFGGTEGEKFTSDSFYTALFKIWTHTEMPCYFKALNFLWNIQILVQISSEPELSSLSATL